jgi:Zn-finger nucleic acid-binding protein
VTRIKCPRCGQPTFAQLEGAVEGDICPGCGGLWLGPGLARQLSDPHGLARAIRRLADDAASRAPFGGGIGNLRVRCPRCNAAMQRFAHPRSGVVVDICAEHGTWFDRGEVQRLVEHASAAGAGAAGGPFRSAPAPAADAPVPLPDTPMARNFNVASVAGPPGPKREESDGSLAAVVSIALDILSEINL